MVKVERKKELLKWFAYGRIKSDLAFSTVMKKTGGNGKGYLDRYFVVHRNYIIYYKPGKSDYKPDDIQEPQGYINLTDCIVDETKTIYNESPLTFQISTKVGRMYYIRGKEEKSIEQFLQIIRPKITLLNTITKEDLGDVVSNIQLVSNSLPRKMKLPDRVKPDGATKFIVEMTAYSDAYKQWNSYLSKVEQFSEHCFGETKAYVDWFMSSDGPHLAMIRCEELVLDNWTDYIKKTAQEINTYEQTRFFKEDYEDIIQHIRNMITLVDSYNLFHRECHKQVKHTDKYLEEKQSFQLHIDQFSKVPSKHTIAFVNGAEGTIISHINNNNQNNQNNIQLKWLFSGNLLACESRNDGEWVFYEGSFRNEIYGQVLWNNKSWVWSHPKTDYKIRYDWDNLNHSFVYYQPITTTSISMNHSTSKLSLSKKPHPLTVYADWKLTNNIITAVVIGNKAEPTHNVLEAVGQVPIPATLIAAMFTHIQSALDFLDIIEMV